MMKKILKSGIVIFILTLITGLVGYLVRITFARNLTLKEYGLFYAVFSLIFFFAPFRDLGLAESTIYHINKYLAKKDLRKVKGIMIAGLLPQLALGIIMTIIFFILKNFLVNNYFKDPLSNQILTILIILFSFQTILPTIASLFLAYQKIVVFSFSKFLTMFSILVISLFLFKLKIQTYIIPALAYLLGNLLTILIMYILFRIEFKKILTQKAKITKNMVKELFNYAIPIMFSTAGGIFLRYSDVILLTILLGSEAVGLYNIALPVLTIILLFINPIGSFLFPKISNYYHNNNPKGIKRILNLLYNYSLIFALPLALVFFANAKLIIQILFGNKYIGAYNTLRVFTLGFIFLMLKNFNFSIIAGIGKAKERTIILYKGAIANILLDLVLIHFYKVTGAAIATVLGNALMTYLTLKLILKHYPIKINIKQQIKILLSSLIFLGIIKILKNILNLNIYLEIIITVTISSLVYLLLIFATKVLTKKHIKYIKELITT